MNSELVPAAIGYFPSAENINDLQNCLPEEWREIIKPTSKYEDMFSDSAVDKIFVPSVTEIFGSSENLCQKQYQFFKNVNTKKRFNNKGAVAYWIRKFDKENSERTFLVVDTDEKVTASTEDFYAFLTPCFSVY